MKKKLLKISISSFAFFLISLTTFAQVSEIWKNDLSGTVLWQQVNSYGNYIVCTNSELASFNPETGEKIWSSQQFAGIQNSQLQEMTGSPLLSVNQGEAVTLIDPFNGNIKFNSSQAGISELKTKEVLYKANGILVAGTNQTGDPLMLMVDMASGDTQWQIEEKFGRIVTLNELSEEELLIVTLFKIYKINSKSGEIIWKSATSKATEQLESMGAFGSLLQGVAEHAIADEDIKVNFYMHLTKGIFVIAGENKEESQSSSGQTTIRYENNYSAFNISDGSMLWEDAISMKGQLGDFTFYKDEMIILPNNGSRTKINSFDTKTAVGKWGKKGRGITIKGGIYQHVKTEQGILLISQSGDKNYLNFLDPAQGLITFEKPVRIRGEVIRTVQSTKGVLFITTQEINILNTSTGELLFDKSIKTSPSLLEQKDNEIYAYDKQDGDIKLINITAGTVTSISSADLRFEGKEDPSSIELREKGIFISSEQNVAMIDYSGNILFQKYYEAPREPGLKRALLYAQAARAAYIGANSYYVAGALQSAAPEVSQEDAVSGAIVEGFGQAYEELGNAASDFAKQSFQQANARFKATAQGRDFIIILGTVEKDNALFKINKDTGEAEGNINLGKEKDPKYAVDDVTGQVFKKTAENQITSYKL
jgi:outer membrane protein assembly factor BamB